MMDPLSEPNNPNLRDQLDEIVGLSSDTVSDHPRMIAALDIAHSIEAQIDGSVTAVPAERYTCFMHTFGLSDSEIVIRIATSLDHIYPSREFIESLVSDHLIEISTENASDGDVVVYLDDEKIIHVGTLDSGRVLSKWGTGHLWRHRLWEVPAQYGDRVCFYGAISKASAEQAFISFAKEHECPDLIDQLLE